MLVVGLTGTFGTGKTTVAGMFNELGAKLIDADRITHNILKKNKAVIKKISSRFGNEVLSSDGSISRERLARAAFKNKNNIKSLCSIVHPVVIDRIASLLARFKNTDSIIVLDAPLLIESGIHKKVDIVVVVTLDEANILRRCNRAFTPEDIKKRIAYQLPLKQKQGFATFIIDNSASRANTRRQVKKIWQTLNKK